MSGRCKACNKTLSYSEMIARNPITQDFEDLCNNCRTLSKTGEWELTDDERYVQRFTEDYYRLAPLDPAPR